jgi:bifunctional NMN adenylyltransferase/nudix hydrolase
MTKTLSTIIGRFSLFHNGHAHLVTRALKHSEFVLILVGSSGQVRTIKNPFTFEERAQVISNYVRSLSPATEIFINPEPGSGTLITKNTDSCVIIMPLHDHIYNDLEWITEVQQKVTCVKDHLPIDENSDIFLTGADRDESTWYLQAFGDFFKKDLVTDSPIGLKLNATELRDKLFQSKGKCLTDSQEIHPHVPSATIEFLYNFKDTSQFTDLLEEYAFIEKYKQSWKTAPYAPTFVTTDACVIQSGHILVNVRDNFPGKGLWALPGGFLEQNEKMVDGCIRELVEETSIELSKAQLYGSIKAQQVFDAPGRSLRGRTITQCFLLKLDDSKSLPKVKPQKGEVKNLMWLPINEALSNTDKWFEDHLEMVKWGVKECNR